MHRKTHTIATLFTSHRHRPSNPFDDLTAEVYCLMHSFAMLPIVVFTTLYHRNPVFAIPLANRRSCSIPRRAFTAVDFFLFYAQGWDKRTGLYITFLCASPRNGWVYLVIFYDTLVVGYRAWGLRLGGIAY